LTPRSRLVRYGISVVIILVVVVIREFVIPAWSLAHPYVLFYPAIILVGWFGGFGPGVLATILAALSLTYLWLPPLYSLRIQDIQDASGLMLFIGIGFAISLFTEARLQAERRARDAEAAAQRARERR
jgi:two-component system sensor histidine kinase/response regulator